ncbi:glycosyltransferase, group 2 family protein [Necator americanus]|uniref:Glycosyltransferase, group 2 family protein n=1 Tax=Necator americanus TaxID=51031 RepID=W2TVF4_NECAM|nr:glycosyltransferase, group 2 family protein [Necator americanus]ETN85763.1 glycosyltransferase, group 2 family protein [Necator americanus]
MPQIPVIYPNLGIFERTSAHLLHEVILYEDASEEEHALTDHLNKFASVMGYTNKMRVTRSEERQGLIRAKALASRQATGDIIVFLDSHCEVTERWLEPLLAPIKENPNSIVLPIIDLINPFTFDYAKAMVTKSGFDWTLTFKWVYIPWEYFDIPENNVKPFDSPAMPGGLLAVRREYFRTLGEYDMGMEIWGAENIELSLKTWMCGGRVVVAPCSRVGHVFRYRRPYKGKPFMDTTVHNSARVAKTWMDDHAKHFFRARSLPTSTDVGDISVGLELKKRLNCKNMEWYMKNVYPDLKVPEYKHDEL